MEPLQLPDHPLRRATDLNSPPPSEPPFKKHWIAFVSHLTRVKAPMGLIYAGSLIILLGWWGVQHQQEQIVNAQRDADIRNTAQALYVQQVQSWAKASADYTLCLDSVSRSDLNRQQWLDIAQGLKELGATNFAERVLHGPVLSSKPREESDCLAPGPAPKVPESLEGQTITFPADSTIPGLNGLRMGTVRFVEIPN